MATVTMTVVDNILKEVYEGQVKDQLESSVKTLRRIEKTSEGVTSDVGGKYVRFAIRTKRNHGIGARNENEALPVPQAQGYDTAQLKLAYLYGAIQLTGQTFELAESNFQAFASALDQEVSGLKQNLTKDTNRQVYGTSAGKLATTNAAGTTTTLVMTNAEAIYLEIGMFVDLFDSADASKLVNAEITNVEKDTPSAGSTTVTFTPADGVATASGDYITRTKSSGKEKIGFREIVQDSGVLYNIDPAVSPVWKSVIDDPGSLQAISEGRMINMIDDITTNGGDTTVAFTSLGVRRAYFNLLVQQRQIVNTQKFEGGFTGLAFTTDEGEIPIVSDLDCPWHHMFFLNEKEIKLYQAGDWSWMNRDGSNWQRVIGTTGASGEAIPGIQYHDAYTALMYKYCQIGTHRRNTHGVIKNITEA